LSGSDREPTGLEKFTEGLEHVASAVMPVAQQVLSARRPVAPQQQAAAPSRPIVVDMGPRRAALPAHAAPVAQPVQNPAPTTTVVATEAGGADDAPAVINDYTTFVPATAEDDMTTAGIKIIKNVDLAVQRSMTPKQIVEQILEPFEDSAPMVTAMVSGMTIEQLLEFIEENVPSEWAILSPRGEELITKAFELWQGGAA
jgi:hypothetical protein